MGIHSLQDYIPEGRFRAIGKLRAGRTFALLEHAKKNKSFRRGWERG